MQTDHKLYDPYPHQEDMHNSAARYIMLMMPARSGKDIWMINHVAKRTVELFPIWSKRPNTMSPKWHIWFLAPIYPLAKQLWRDIKSLWPKELIVGSPNESDLSIKLICDGLIEVRSVSDPNKLVASGVDVVAGTECGMWSRAAWDLLKVRLSSPDKLEHSFALLNGTPQGQVDPEDPERMHWQWEMVLYGRNPENWADTQSFYWFEDRIRYGNIEHPILSRTPAGRTELNRMRDDPNTSERVFRQNYLGECLPAITGRAITPEFQPELHIQETRYNPKLPLYRMWDFGRHYPSVTFHQIRMDGVWEVHREYCPILKDLTDEELAQNIKMYTKREFPNLVYDKLYDIGDFEAAQKQDARRETTAEVFRDKYDINLDLEPTPTGADKDACNIIKGRLKLRADGSPAFVINPKCELSIKCLQGMWTYEEYKIQGHTHQRENVNPIHPWIDIFDTFKYFVIRVLKTGMGRQTVKHRRLMESERVFNHKTGLWEYRS